MYAAVNGYLSTTEFLGLTCKCNVNATDKTKRTALHWAARMGND